MKELLTCTEKKGPSLEHMYQVFKTDSCFPGAEIILVHHFKTAGLQTAALGYHPSEQDI